MGKTFKIATVLCIVLGMGLLFAGAYTICGGELTFTAEGEFERVVVKYPNAMYDLVCIYEDGGSFSYLTSFAPKFEIFQVIVYTLDGNYFDFVDIAPIEVETYEIGDVQITIKSGYEAMGTINLLEWDLIIFGGLVLGMIFMTLVDLALKSKGINI